MEKLGSGVEVSPLLHNFVHGQFKLSIGERERM